jgi:FKBP-type peptidyl-prolyl cis-trans isomerase SlyD
MQVAKNAVVTIDYTLTNPSGEVIDSSVGKQPLPYLHGTGNLIPGLEKALEGKKAGDQLKVTVPPDEAYGNRDESLVQSVPKTAFQGVPDIKLGMQFRTQADQAGGAPGVVTVTKVEGDKVTVDGNHALAGIPLTFDVTIKDVRKATQEELLHGHVHGPGGHHH